jgi:inorganic pyrophosphatase
LLQPYKNPDGTYNMIVEIPKWSRRKFEIATGELYNPIKQDVSGGRSCVHVFASDAVASSISRHSRYNRAAAPSCVPHSLSTLVFHTRLQVKNGTLREYAWGDMIFNYGCVPQTWEDPKFVHPDTQAGGDNDPIDIVDVGAKMWSTGSIVRVKLLGVLAMIDDGETDWKLIGINAEDPAADLLNDIDDLAVHMPGASEALHRWLKYYKTPTINKFAFEGAAQPRAFAKQVLEETHEQWRKLVEAQGRSATVSK